MKEVCTTFGIGMIPYSPLAGGFLTGKYRRDAAVASARAEGVRKRYMNERASPCWSAWMRTGHRRA